MEVIEMSGLDELVLRLKGPNIFGHLKNSEILMIGEILQESGGAERIANLFREYLEGWRNDMWIDDENIFYNLIFLRNAGLWKQIPLAHFIATYTGNVCSAVVNSLKANAAELEIH